MRQLRVAQDRDLEGVVVPLDGGSVEGGERAGWDVFGGGPVVDEA